jgi:hypothetical protein
MLLSNDSIVYVDESESLKALGKMAKGKGSPGSPATWHTAPGRQELHNERILVPLGRADG